MNLDAASPKAADVDLCDAWEDIADPSTPALERLEKELKWNVWGYQEPNKCSARRLSKFFYTRMADAVPLSEVLDLIGKVGRLGISVKAKVKTWEYDVEPRSLASFVLSSGKSHSDTWREGSVRKELVVRASDHFGIAIGIRVR